MRALPLLLLLAACGPKPAAQPELKLDSTSVTLPNQDEALPPGPRVDLVTADCTGCHSAGMILAQPRLKPEQWRATVDKMQKVYHAPVPDEDVPAILAYLGTLGGAERLAAR